MGEIIRLGLVLAATHPEKLRIFQFLLRSLTPGVQSLSAPELWMDLTANPVRPAHAPEFLISSSLAPGMTLSFELEVQNPLGVWRDTLSIPLAPGPDLTPPRVGLVGVHPMPGGMRFALLETQIVDGSEWRIAEAAIYELDGDLLATVPLEYREGRFSGAWLAPKAGIYQVRAEVEDLQGNRGVGPFQIASALAGPIPRTGPWEPLSLLDQDCEPGIQYLTLAPSAPTAIYASHPRWGAWRSIDEGTSWQRIGLMTGRQLLVDARAPFTIYTGGVEALRSRDGGLSWQSLADPEVALLAADPFVSGRLFGRRGEVNRLAISGDCGDTWQEAQPEGIQWVQVHPVDSCRVYAGSPFRSNAAGDRLPGFVYRSNDGGRQWERSELAQAFDTLVLDPGDPESLYATAGESLWHSADCGRTWRLLHEFPASAFGQRLLLAAHPRAPELIFVWYQLIYPGRGWWETRDGGQSWQKRELPDDWLLRLVLHPQDPERLFRLIGPRESERSGLQRSRDGGRTWEDLPLPRVAPPAEAVRFDLQGRLYVGMERWDERGFLIPGFYRSDDRGQTWNWRGDEQQGFWWPPWRTSGLKGLYIDSALALVYLEGQWWLSRDEGQTWKRVGPQGSLSSTYGEIQADPRQPGAYYLLDSGVYRSTDYGATWESLHAAPVGGLAVDPAGVLYLATGDTVWQCGDPGQPWRYAGHLGVAQPISMLAINPHDAQQFYAAVRSGLYCSTDQGATWSRVVNLERRGYSPRFRLCFAPGDPQKIYFATGPELLESRDGGRTWQSIGQDLASVPWFNDMVIDPFFPELLYVATPWGIYRFGGQEQGTAVTADFHPFPSTFALDQNYPNPFNHQTHISYRLPRPTQVRLTIYNLAGQPVRGLVDGFQEGGNHQVLWDGRDDRGQELASGVYFYRLCAAAHQATRKLLLLK